MITLMLAAAAITLAEPIDISSWLTTKDYPTGSGLVAERGYVIYRLTVSPEGRVIRCETQERSTIGLSVCNALEARATFTPATDAAGKPVFSIYENMKAFRVEGMDMPPRPKRSAFALTVDHLPAGAPDPSFAKLGLLVDAAGNVTRCEPLQWERAQPIDIAMLFGKIACSELSYIPKPALDANGQVVPSVQSIMVRFHTKADAPH